MGEPDRYERYNRDLIRGLEYEDFVYTLLQRHKGLTVVPYRSPQWQDKVGENSAGFEIKFNEKYDTTGNLYIETARKSHAKQQVFKASGIYRPDNMWLFLTGSYLEVFAFTRSQLLEIETSCQIVVKATSKGFLIPAGTARRVAQFIIIPTAEDRPDQIGPELRTTPQTPASHGGIEPADWFQQHMDLKTDQPPTTPH